MKDRAIDQTLRRVRNHLARITLGHDLLQGLLLLTALFTTSVWYESRLYLSSPVRLVIMWGLVDVTMLLVLVITMRWLGIWRGWWTWVQYDSLAARVGYKLGTPRDRLLNALQLERRLARSETETSGENIDLLGRSVELVRRRLARLDFHTLTPRRYHPSARLVKATLVILLLAWIIHPSDMSHATVRLMNPDRSYPVPKPFILLSLSGDQQVLGGDTTEVAFTGFEAVPRQIELVWEDNQGRVSTASLPLKNGRFTFRFETMFDDIRYYARYRNPSWFSPWDQVTSNTHTIAIIDRPVIEELSFYITPPTYTGEPVKEVGGHVAGITALIGSLIQFSATTNLPLGEGWLNIDGEVVPTLIAGRLVEGSFTLEKSVDLSLSVVDQRGVANVNPVHYAFTALPDYPPSLTLILPAADVDLDETMLIPISFDIADDYGFSRAQLIYGIHHPDYLSPDNQIYTHDIPELDLSSPSQRVSHIWDLDPLNLAPGDQVQFHIEVYDNNVVSGPGKAVSGPLIARIPTLAELFAEVSERSYEAAAITDKVLEDLEKVRTLLDEMDLSFRGDEQVSWAQQQKGKEVLQSLQQVLEAMESVQAQIRDLDAQSEDNGLFSAEILSKYKDLQNLLEEIMTPELEDAMARFRAALEQMDPQQFKDALKNLQFQSDEFEAQLDRFLDIFRQALAEMKMDEVVKRLEQMIATEEQLLKQLNDSSGVQTADPTADQAPEEDDESHSARRMQDLAARHREQERTLDATREIMRDAAQAMEPYSPQAAQRLNDLHEGDLIQETQSSLQRGTQALQGRQRATSQSQLQVGREMLSSLAAEAADIQAQFQQSTVKEMMAKFQQVLSSVLTTSKLQEDLYLEIENMSSSSPRIREAAETQHQLLNGMSQIIEQFMALSRQSFNITPRMGRSVGRANAAMHKAVGDLTANNPRAAAQAERESMAALNETAMALSNAMIDMQQSGSASGFEQYLQRMQNLGQGQQALNEQTLSLQLGQMAAMSQVELMRRLQARQRQLSQTLDQLLRDYPSQGSGKQGGLGAALDDMDKVIKDFQRRRVTRRTLDRQQKILTRLLDSQKSLAVRGFKDERKGTTPTGNFTYLGPDGLPADRGERADLILRAMEQALRTGYSQEYQVIIQNYFRRLADRTTRDE